MKRSEMAFLMVMFFIGFLLVYSIIRQSGDDYTAYAVSTPLMQTFQTYGVIALSVIAVVVVILFLVWHRQQKYFF